ncbi:MAG: tyrosine-type recombinase/integrase [Blastocatellia bacterium]
MTKDTKALDGYIRDRRDDLESRLAQLFEVPTVSMDTERKEVGKISPHHTRRTAITTALDQGLSYQRAQMMSGHRDPKTVIRYDHHKERIWSRML